MNWENEARRILKAELARRGVTYERLAGRLEAIGVKETERSIANKMSRGTFPFTFVLQCIKAIGADALTLICLSNKLRSRGLVSDVAKEHQG